MENTINQIIDFFLINELSINLICSAIVLITFINKMASQTHIGVIAYIIIFINVLINGLVKGF